MDKKKITLLIILFIVLMGVFIVPKTISKYTKKLSRSIVLNVIEIENLTYFEEYDGSNNFLGFDKTDITSFSRNTTLTKQEVLEIDGVELISNTEDDGYTSTEEVYGWVDNNNFYWWSEADVVYFHPETLGAFRGMSNLVTVDLTGTSTSKVENFSRWFYNDQVLENIYGKINTSGLKLEYSTSQRKVSLSYMFAYCYLLNNLDLSEFDTHNATDLSNLFNRCQKMTRIDISTFDTSNVVNMNRLFSVCSKLETIKFGSKFDTSNTTDLGNLFDNCKVLTGVDFSIIDTSKAQNISWMFYSCEKLKVVDLSTFDTSNVTDMSSMFAYSKVEVLILGEKFDTSKITKYLNCFLNSKIRVIYAKNDFTIKENANVTDFFLGATNLVGGFNTNYTTPYDADYVQGEYAKISNANQSGYFTYYNSVNDLRYSITYELNGGSANVVDEYYIGVSSISLNQPVKEGYTFLGWTGSNGNIPELSVAITLGSTGDKHYIANYIKENEYVIEGPCTFRGQNNNIQGNNCGLVSDEGYLLPFTNSKYINTGIQLFNEDNISKDFEISFTIDSVTSYTNQATLISSMMESGSPWPGFVFRISTSDSAFLLRAGYNGNSNWLVPYTAQDIVIKRTNGILSYSVDGSSFTQIVDFNNYSGTFDYPVTIGAGLNENKSPRRYFTGTLSNISIRIIE